MNKIKELKLELKSLAVEIRGLKATRKSHDYGYVPGLWRSKYEARHKHIAYCMLRGRTYEQVENSCRETPNMKYVEEIMEAFREEDVCTGT